MKRSSLLTALCAVAAATTLQGQVIGDFEGSLDPGWVVTAGTGTPVTTWASSGSYSLQVTPAASGFAWGLQFNDIPTVDKLTSSHYLQFDVYWDSSEWLPETGGDAWVRWDIGSLNSEAGWQQITDAEITDPANPSYPGSWDPFNWGATHQRTLTYDFTGLGYDVSGATWAQFNLSYNLGGAETIGNFYIDNVQLVPVPEPTTFALLGLAGLLITVRRRLR
jgi:hypothetical protein